MVNFFFDAECLLMVMIFFVGLFFGVDVVGRCAL